MIFGSGIIVRGSSTPTPPPSDPSIAWTGEYLAEPGNYTESSGHVTVWSDLSGNGRDFTSEGVDTNGPVIAAGATPSGKNAISSPGTTYGWLTSDPNQATQFMTASAWYASMTHKVNTITKTDADSWDNHGLWNGFSGDFGLMAKDVAGVKKLYAFNYDGSDDPTGTITYTTGTWVLTEVWLDSGTLTLRVGGPSGSTATVSTGNTAALTEKIVLSLGYVIGGTYTDMQYRSFRIINSVPSAGDRDANAEFLMYDCGI